MNCISSSIFLFNHSSACWASLYFQHSSWIVDTGNEHTTESSIDTESLNKNKNLLGAWKIRCLCLKPTIIRNSKTQRNEKSSVQLVIPYGGRLCLMLAASCTTEPFTDISLHTNLCPLTLIHGVTLPLQRLNSQTRWIQIFKSSYYFLLIHHYHFKDTI